MPGKGLGTSLIMISHARIYSCPERLNICFANNAPSSHLALGHTDFSLQCVQKDAL